MLCVAMAFFWMHSLHSIDWVDVGRANGITMHFLSYPNRISGWVWGTPVKRIMPIAAVPQNWLTMRSNRLAAHQPIRYADQGFQAGWHFGDGLTKPWSALVGAPYWFVIFLCGVIPFCRLMVLLRDHRRLTLIMGHCTTCGYDLRATPDRCPECGKVPEKKEVISG